MRPFSLLLSWSPPTNHFYTFVLREVNVTVSHTRSGRVGRSRGQGVADKPYLKILPTTSIRGLPYVYLTDVDSDIIISLALERKLTGSAKPVILSACW